MMDMTPAASQPADRATRWRIAGLIVAFALALTLHGALSRPSLDVYQDMYENFGWGITWQWGYYKHPPFFAWETAGWFLIFPRTDFFYFLLSGVNASVALFAVWRIAARFGGGGFQLLAVVLAMLMPPISFLGVTFNANSAMTPIWALLVLFYLRGLEGARIVDAVVIGALAAAALLTKYHSGVILAALLIHALLDGIARKTLFSLFGLVAMVTFLVCMAPHVYWLFRNDFLPLTYAAHQDDGVGANLSDTLRFLITPIGYGALATLAARSMRDLRDPYEFVPLGGWKKLGQSVTGRAMIAFAVLPILLTVVLGWAADAELSAVWGIPFYTAYAIMLALLVPPAYYEPRKNRAYGWGIAFMAVLVAVAPLWYQVEKKRNINYYIAPMKALAAEMDSRWQSVGGGDGGIVFGSGSFASAMAFYSKLDLMTVEGNSFALSANYLSAEDIRKRGLIGICWDHDGACIETVKAQMPPTQQPETVTLPSDVNGENWTFNIWMTPPAP